MASNFAAARSGGRTRLFAAVTLSFGIAVAVVPRAYADQEKAETDTRVVQLPAVPGWFDDKPAIYVSTDASDPDVAKGGGLNFVARLGAAANTPAVDDIYTVTNFTQSNIIPSAPIPTGPKNANTAYSPLWQLSKVTWNWGFTPHLLTSEQAVLDAKTLGLVTVTKTNIVINCPVVYTPQGGLLAGTRILSSDR